MSVGQIGPVYVPQTARPPETIPPAPQVIGVVVRVANAGFWMRALAFFVDNLIVGFLFTAVVVLDTPAFLTNPDLTALRPSLIPPLTALGFIVFYFMVWLYFAFFEGSAWQATPGKRIFGIYVTDLNGRPLSFARAALRNAARMLSGVLLLGYLMAGLTEKKQALHDLLAGCLVMRRR